ncbi:MAG: hypothetical protein QXE81_06315 [Desulfurococcaceae archaeon]
MTSVKHLLIDILNLDTETKNRILGSLERICRKLNGIPGSMDTGLDIYICQNGFIYVQQRGKLLLMDLFDSENVFDKILEYLPMEYVMIRLVERGLPEY